MRNDMLQNQPMPAGERLLTLKEFARRLNVGDGCIRALRKQGKLRVIAINQRVLRVPESEAVRIAAL